MMKVLKWFWQLPQHIVSLLYYLYLVTQNKIWEVKKIDNCVIFTKGTTGSVTLGKYVFLSYLASDKVRKHEMGHTIQSLYLGPLYLLVIGIPSFLWACTHNWIAPHKSYDWFYTEAWANKLGNVE